MRKVLSVGLPLSLTNVGFVLMGAVDVALVAPLGERSLAAMALAITYASAVLQLGGNLFAPVNVLVTRARIAGSRDEVASVLRHAIALAVVVSLVEMMLLVLPETVLRLLAGADQPPAVISEGVVYARALAWGIPGAVGFTVLFNFAEGHMRMWIGVWLLGAANVVNAIGDVGLIYGHWGLPQLGSAGSAWCTSGVRLASCAAILVYLVRDPELRPAARFGELFRIGRAKLVQLARLGLPLGLRTGVRQVFYAVLTAMVARFGTAALAGNQIAASLFVVATVLHSGFGSGVAVLIAGHVEQRDGEGASRVLRHAAILGGGFAAVAGVGLIVLAGPIARLYSRDLAVVAACVPILRVCAVAQLASAFAVLTVGAAMALLETRYLARTSVALQLALGVPLAWLLAFGAGLGAAAVWWAPVLTEALLAGFLLRLFGARTRAFALSS